MLTRKEFFNRAAHDWDEKYATVHLSTFLEKTVPKFGLRKGQDVLDVGTGTGLLIPYQLDCVGSSGSVTAIDYATKMMEKCRLKFSSLKNLNIRLLNVEQLDYPPETFHVAICFGVFPHIPNKPEALLQINRALKLGGRFIIAHALSSHEIEIHHRKAPTVAFDALPKNGEMKNLLKSAGFDDVSITDQPGCYLCISTKL